MWFTLVKILIKVNDNWSIFFDSKEGALRVTFQKNGKMYSIDVAKPVTIKSLLLVCEKIMENIER